jgi:hypothetical protein
MARNFNVRGVTNLLMGSDAAMVRTMGALYRLGLIDNTNTRNGQDRKMWIVDNITNIMRLFNGELIPPPVPAAPIVADDSEENQDWAALKVDRSYIPERQYLSGADALQQWCEEKRRTAIFGNGLYQPVLDASAPPRHTARIVADRPRVTRAH